MRALQDFSGREFEGIEVPALVCQLLLARLQELDHLVEEIKEGFPDQAEALTSLANDLVACARTIRMKR